MTAPMVALKSEPDSPARADAKMPEEEPTNDAPITPTIMSTSQPKPRPFMISPASQPATSPINRNQRRLTACFSGPREFRTSQ